MKGQSRLDQIMDYLKSHNLVTVDPPRQQPFDVI